MQAVLTTVLIGVLEVQHTAPSEPDVDAGDRNPGSVPEPEPAPLEVLEPPPRSPDPSPRVAPEPAGPLPPTAPPIAPARPRTSPETVQEPVLAPDPTAPSNCRRGDFPTLDEYMECRYAELGLPPPDPPPPPRPLPPEYLAARRPPLILQGAGGLVAATGVWAWVASAGLLARANRTWNGAYDELTPGPTGFVEVDWSDLAPRFREAERLNTAVVATAATGTALVIGGLGLVLAGGIWRRRVRRRYLGLHPTGLLVRW